ncbi:MAG: nuclear transport factor 2 family protein [Bacteroidota bacterium]
MPITLQQNQAMLQFFAAYNDCDVPTMLDSFSPQGTVMYAPLGESGYGPAREVGKVIWGMLVDCFANLRNELHASQLNEAGEIVCRLSIAGDQVKDFAEIKNKGFSFEEEHIFVFRLNPTHQIEHLKITWNHDSLRRQLGAA